MDIDIDVRIERQPDYTTCGPTALHAMCRDYGDPIELSTVIAEAPKLPSGGTLAVRLAVHALSSTYEAIALDAVERPGSRREARLGDLTPEPSGALEALRPVASPT